jgi:hypothetical protein
MQASVRVIYRTLDVQEGVATREWCFGVVEALRTDRP